MVRAWLNGYGVLSFLAIAVCIGASSLAIMQRNTAPDIIKEAYSQYVSGETTKSPGIRQEAFNAALRNYTLLESKFDPKYGTGKLYYDIGNTYYQLGVYPWGIYYLYRAQKLLPRESVVRQNLTIALSKVGLPPVSTPTTVSKALFFHTMLSVPEKLQLFSLFTFAVFIAGSLAIWRESGVSKKVSLISCIPAIILLGSLLYGRYVSPLEGVLVTPANIYKDAGEQYAKVSEAPLQGGLKVDILDVREKGKWLKIQDPNGTLGYIKKDAVRLVK